MIVPFSQATFHRQVVKCKKYSMAAAVKAIFLYRTISNIVPMYKYTLN
jgi:hypothetical protein